ncbi:phosphoribosylanthranilate isomerase [Archaeoglobus profundus]|uniref:N-(5'-phosphoribosyl)anthranilate isomerase n=1 Tax=Archaeoglobus profundus (strain DSM 5631 / JCM 9629 / NBRC 100127 / Av18) TaxID=572546 RepID=D2RG55_ARCPA|nr:phosphoribosylanthranilate isomerase [Archaeoglobus profundus]ADB57280.1 Phosphoribosylanthranilate isomerase [Archaeoglobus profundus DSM 5631]
MFVKICGIKSLEELEIVEKYANATGVVVECESKRRITLEKAREIIECANIPVFVVSTLTDLNAWMRVIEKTQAEYIQIHAEVSPDLVGKVKELDIKVMKAFRVPRLSENPERDAKSLIEKIELYDVDLILLDTGKGSGLIHDHRVSRIVAKEFDIILAGGLNPQNVAKIVEFVKPFGVDVSSGVEKNGRKDEKLVTDFVREVRRFES